MLEEEQDDYHCGQCTEGNTGCSNEYAGEGFQTPPSNGALSPWPSLPRRHLLTDAVRRARHYYDMVVLHGQRLQREVPGLAAHSVCTPAWLVP